MLSRLLPGLTIVISPLISLINEQLLRLPRNLAGACIHSSLSYQDIFKVIADAKKGELDLILTTPEKFALDEIQCLENVSLVCIDEVHCMSVFSSNSRFAYKLLPTLLGKSQRILGLTGTADRNTTKDLARALKITKFIKSGSPLRANIDIRISHESNVIDIASRLLRTERFCNGSVIVYSPYQNLCDTLVQWLNSKGENAASYHGGISHEKRDEIYQKFSVGAVRVLVATLSFGMGIDKKDIRGTIHLYLPKTMEQLIQETGRAGRDGAPCSAHILCDDSAFYHSRALAYANYISKRNIISVVKMLKNTGKRERADQTVGEESTGFWKVKENCEDLGLSKESFYDLLLKLEEKGILKIEGIMPATLQLRFYRTQPEDLAGKYSIISHVLAKANNYAGVRRIKLELLAESMGLPSKDILYALKRLAATGEISCEFSDDSFVVSPGEVPNNLELPETAGVLQKELFAIQENLVDKLENCYQILLGLSKNSYSEAENVNEQLQGILREYYNGNIKKKCADFTVPPDIENDFLSIFSMYDGVPEAKDLVYILQGVNTLKTPADRWRQIYIWGRYSKCNFKELVTKADEFILQEISSKADYIQKKIKKK